MRSGPMWIESLTEKIGNYIFASQPNYRRRPILTSWLFSD